MTCDKTVKVDNIQIIRKFDDIRTQFYTLERAIKNHSLFPIEDNDSKDDNLKKLICTLIDKMVIDITDFTKLIYPCSPWDPRCDK